MRNIELSKKQKAIVLVIAGVIFTSWIVTASLSLPDESNQDNYIDDNEIEENFEKYLNQPFYDYQTFEKFQNYTINMLGFGWRNQPEYNHHLMIQYADEGHMIVYDISDNYMTQGIYNITNSTLAINKRTDIPWAFGGGQLMWPGNWEKIVID